jgi:hypothetical protein
MQIDVVAVLQPQVAPEREHLQGLLMLEHRRAFGPLQGIGHLSSRRLTYAPAGDHAHVGLDFAVVHGSIIRCAEA